MSTIHDVREVKPTRLMYKTNLSWNVMSDVLDYLTDKGLLSTRRVGARRTISLTQMGVTCLQRLKEARSLLLTAADISDRLLSSNDVKEGVPDLTPKHFFSNDGGTT
jgi:predicted transcriptional regulator